MKYLSLFCVISSYIVLGALVVRRIGWMTHLSLLLARLHGGYYVCAVCNSTLEVTSVDLARPCYHLLHVIWSCIPRRTWIEERKDSAGEQDKDQVGRRKVGPICGLLWNTKFKIKGKHFMGLSSSHLSMLFWVTEVKSKPQVLAGRLMLSSPVIINDGLKHVF